MKHTRLASFALVARLLLALAGRKARTFDEIRAQFARWDATIGGVLRQQEIDDVDTYPNERYDRPPCPPSICLVQRAQAKPLR